MDRAVGEPVELATGRLEDGDAALGRGLERLAHAVVGVDPARDVHRRDRDVGAQRLDDRVAAGDDLGRRLGPPLERPEPRAGRPCGRGARRIPGLGAARLATAALADCAAFLAAGWYSRSAALGVGPLPSNAFSALSAGPDGRALAGLAHRSAPL